MRKPATFTFTVVQLRLLTEHSAKTGLHKVEIVRRALDEYFEREQRKAAARKAASVFTEKQKGLIVQEAKKRGISEKAVCQQIVDSYFDPDASP